MAAAGPNWESYLGGVAAFAGTLFALVLAARQIRGRLVEDPPPKVSRAYFVDSIAVTVELGAAACLALLYSIEESVLFSFAAGTIAIFGFSLSFSSATAYLQALRDRLLWREQRERREALLQTVGNILPAACYVAAFLYAVRVFEFNGKSDWGYAAAVSWLTFSGTVQAIWWYARIWETEKRTRQ